MDESASRFRSAPIWLGLLGNPGLILLIVGITRPNLHQLEVIFRFAILSMALNGIGLITAIAYRLRVKPPPDAVKLGLVINVATALMWLGLWALAFYLGPKGTVVV
ncbi:MAG TPA: hypothetical protein VFC86_12840 [Planctomycetota bacterium]|nr:hypothetical protein [Planctomycetota bacterium]